MKALIIQNKRIGDVLISSVIANNFKRKYPDSEVHFLAYDYTTDVLQNNPNIDTVFAVKEKELKKLSELFKFIQQTRKMQYDFIFDPYSKMQSRLICKFSKAKKTVGNKSRKRLGNLNFYTHPVAVLEEKSLPCGKAIEDRIYLMQQVDTFDEIDYQPKLFLSDKEKNSTILDSFSNKTVIVLSVLGSTPQKSMPYEYVAALADYLSDTFDAILLFNYAPHQKQEMLKIYNLCKNKEAIQLDIYANSIRDFIVLMNKADMLIGNEGGAVHIAKALNKPTFTIFSPYVSKNSWASFEDGKFHKSVHLLEEKPELYEEFTFESRKKIEENPTFMYQQLTPEIILPKLHKFMVDNIAK